MDAYHDKQILFLGQNFHFCLVTKLSQETGMLDSFYNKLTGTTTADQDNMTVSAFSDLAESQVHKHPLHMYVFI